jgi:hypothetical protein
MLTVEQYAVKIGKPDPTVAAWLRKGKIEGTSQIHSCSVTGYLFGRPKFDGNPRLLLHECSGLDCTGTFVIH